MAINDVYKLVCIQSQNNISIANVFHFKQLAAEGAENPFDSLTQMFTEHFVPEWQAICSDRWSLTDLLVNKVGPPPEPSQEFNFTTGSGDFIQEPLPPNQCLVIRTYTGVWEKFARGRMHLSGIPVTVTQQGSISGTYFGLVQAFGAKFTATHTKTGLTIPWRACVWSELFTVANEITHTVELVGIKTLRSRTR